MKKNLADRSSVAASYCRFSSDLQNDRSIIQQQEECREKASQLGHDMQAGLQFDDQGISGTKLDRPGLNAMLAAAEAGKFAVLYLYSLSRLSRNAINALQLVNRLVSVFNVRVICVKDPIDSATPQWQLMVHLLSMFHERFIVDLSASVLRGQADNVLQHLSVGDYAFGYKTEAIPGMPARGRQRKAPRVYKIDPVTSGWVCKIFDWFTVEQQSIAWIVRELNRLGAPKDHRATSKTWRHAQVFNVLRNAKYIGKWSWGKRRNKRNPETGQLWQELRDEDETKGWERLLPDLRIISDEQFQAAQARLEQQASQLGRERRTERGTLRGRAGTRRDLTPKHLLNGLLVCGECQSPLHQGGAFGKYYFCPRVKSGECQCRTTLQRARAERLVLAAVQRRLLSDVAWADQVFEVTLRAWQEDARTTPGEVAALERRIQETERIISRLIDQCEQEDVPNLKERLKQRNAEKRQFEDALLALTSRNICSAEAPTRVKFQAQLKQLCETITSVTPAASKALRDLLGGKLTIEQILPPGKKRGFLRGTLNWQIRPLGTAELGDVQSETIDFQAEPPQRELAVRAHELLRQGLLLKEVGVQLGVSKSNLTRLLKKATEYGLPAVAGTARRKTLQRKQTEPSQAVQLADQVQALSEAGLLLTEIAERLGCNRDTVTAAKVHWYRSRGLPIPDGRTRRKSLSRKSRPRLDTNDDQAGPAAA